MQNVLPSEPHRRRGPTLWPFILIGIGIVWLLGELHVISAANLSVLFRLWPVILIAIGVELLVGRNSRALSTLIGFGTVALLLVLMVIGPSLGLSTNVDVQSANYTEPIGETRSAEINLNIGVGQLDVRALRDSNELFKADVNYVGDLNYETSGDTEKTITLNNNNRDGFDPFTWLTWLSDGDQLQWQVGLSPDVPLALNVESGTSSTTLDLSGIQLASLEAHSGTGGIDMTLPSVADSYNARVETGTGGTNITITEGAALNLDVNSGTGGVEINLPQGAAVRLTGSVGTGSIDVPSSFRRIEGGDKDRFVGDSGTWETANFANADRQIIIEFDGGTGGLNINQ